MAKFINTALYDVALSYLQSNGDKLCVCSSAPVDYTTAITTYKLAIKTITSGDYTGPTAGDGGGNSRKITVNEQATITIDSSGTATYIAIASSGLTQLLISTTCTSQELTSGGGNTVTIPAWKWELSDIS